MYLFQARALAGHCMNAINRGFGLQSGTAPALIVCRDVGVGLLFVHFFAKARRITS
jgi:hypothetical protein